MRKSAHDELNAVSAQVGSPKSAKHLFARSPRQNRTEQGRKDDVRGTVGASGLASEGLQRPEDLWILAVPSANPVLLCHLHRPFPMPKLLPRCPDGLLLALAIHVAPRLRASSLTGVMQALEQLASVDLKRGMKLE